MPDIQLLQATVDADDESYFRLLVDSKFVKYITVDSGVYSTDDMCFGPSLISLLPALPAGEWNIGHIRRHPETGAPHFATYSKTQLPGITSVWHSTQVNYLELSLGEKVRSGIYEATHPRFENSTFLVKFARFPWEVPQREKETEAYEWIEGHDIGPPFLGHLVEEGERVIGFLMERITDFRHATPDDLGACRSALKKLHALGIKHGDVNKHNFLVRNQDGRAIIIDFDCASRVDDADELEHELSHLKAQLSDTSGRGGQIVESGPS
jgi:predicted Ser/Thr protein kinase